MLFLLFRLLRLDSGTLLLFSFFSTDVQLLHASDRGFSDFQLLRSCAAPTLSRFGREAALGLSWLQFPNVVVISTTTTKSFALLRGLRPITSSLASLCFLRLPGLDSDCTRSR